MRLFKYIFLVLCTLSTQQGIADDLFADSYDWNESGQFELFPNVGNDQNSFVIKDLKTVEYYYDTAYESLMQLYTVHTKVQVNTHEAVEDNNKVYLPMAHVVSVEDLRARVITKKGVNVVEDIDLKDYEGQDKYSSYKYFAVEGVEVGSQIEYIYTLKMSPQLDGGREFFQSEELKLDTEFNIYCQDHLVFKTKSYNGFEPMQLDTTIAGKNRYYAHMDKIEPLIPESYAPYANSLMRVEYKLDYIEPTEAVKLYTYKQLAKQIDSFLRSEISKKDMKAIKNLADKLELDKLTDYEKISAIEVFIKRNINISEQSIENGEVIDYVLENQVASQRGAIKLYIALLDYVGINYRYGLTSDRQRVKMDPDFESYAYLEEYFFYFPDFDKYLAPTEVLYRIGYIPYEWTDNYGLFINSEVKYEARIVSAEVNYIPALPYNLNEDNLDVSINFTGNFESLNIDIERKLSGYNATFIQPIFEWIPEQDIKSVVNELLNLSGKDVDLQDFKLIDFKMDSIYLKPFTIKGKATSQSAFYDKAGSRYLLKIGEVIGEQVEMYQEEERKLPVENEFNRNYERRIRIEIPDGYKVRNLDDLNMDIYYEKDDQIPMGFHSEYNVEGNTVSIVIKEYYKKLDFPVEDFEKFREIINAAADFNKKVLVFERS